MVARHTVGTRTDLITTTDVILFSILEHNRALPLCNQISSKQLERLYKASRRKHIEERNADIRIKQPATGKRLIYCDAAYTTPPQVSIIVVHLAMPHIQPLPGGSKNMEASWHSFKSSVCALLRPHCQSFLLSHRPLWEGWDSVGN